MISLIGIADCLSSKYIESNKPSLAVSLSNPEEQTKEKVRFNTEIIKVLSLFFIATGGGVTSLIINGLNSGREVVISAFGMVFVIIIGILGFLVYSNTRKLIE